ncbi:MAG TPA: ACP S-malonyltransferase [Vicinamibacteria bacterium]|nr:ACP S-malonyltransferase [Vicinamibacteria bacterium]
MSKLALVFPGQGSQQVGMGKAIAEERPEARQVFEEADGALGFPLSRLCFEGPEEELKLTENTQPAILTTSVALYRALASQGVEPDFVAGHSLGEYSALVASGALRLDDAVVLVRNRGRYMQEAVPVGEGAMAAILGLGLAEVQDICSQASEGEVVEPANLNAPGQTVVAGHAAAVQRASAAAKERGAKRVIPLSVSAPFHCRLMRPAQHRLERDLANVTVSDLRVPLVSNVDAAWVRTGAEAVDALIRQVASPVRWEESVRRLVDEGVDQFVEVGPGKVLSGLVRKIAENVRVASIEDPNGLRRLLAEVTGV